VSYDDQRQYRSVVTQQGRVALEADANEAWTIAGEEAREEALDVVGPSGTPDDGYRLTVGTAFDLTVGPGTMYVGGVRATLTHPVTYSQQGGPPPPGSRDPVEWLDCSTDPDWHLASAPAPGNKPNELVYLSLAETEVSSVEDPTLTEVALGGPDTSQRVRLVQRIKRLGTTGATCGSAMVDAEAAWAVEGLTFDPSAMRLVSGARLQVSFTTLAAVTDPCQPVGPEGCEPDAQGGYLGADNQLIRIQVTDWDQATGMGKLVWGFDDASFLYRLDVTQYPVVALQSRPPDSSHEPAKDQAVELLRSAVSLGGEGAFVASASGQVTEGAFVASASGQVMKVTTGYVRDGQAIELPPLPPGPASDVRDHSKTPVAFLRVWEEQLDFTRGAPVALNPLQRPTGIQVALTTEDGTSPFHPGDFWLVGVRPIVPTVVYPARLLDKAQPPDGPRLWACPLGVVSWPNQSAVGGLLFDCRNSFEDLVRLTARKEGVGCCDVPVTPKDLESASLQQIMDRFANKGPVNICLAPGTYPLPGPLRLGPQHSGLTLEGCPKGAVIVADVSGGSDPALFAQGMIVMTEASSVTIRDIAFQLPLLPAVTWGSLLTGQGLPDLMSTVEGRWPGTGLAEQMTISIGIRPVNCSLLTVERCAFDFPQPVLAVDPGPGSGSLSMASTPSSASMAFRAADVASLTGRPVAQAAREAVPPGGGAAQSPTPTRLPIDIPPGIFKPPPGPKAAPFAGLFGAGIFAGGYCSGIVVRENVFTGPGESTALQGLFGYLHATSLIPQEGPTGSILPAVLAGSFVGNAFSGLYAAVGVFANWQSVEVSGNTVTECGVGFAFIAPRWAAAAQVFPTLVPGGLTNVSSPTTDLGYVVVALTASPLMLVGSVLARAFPLPGGYVAAGTMPVNPATGSLGAVEFDWLGLFASANAADAIPSPNPHPLPGALSNFLAANNAMLGKEFTLFSLFAQTTPGSACLHLTGNDFRRSLPPVSATPGGAADPPRGLVILGDGDQKGDCIVEGTRLRSTSGTEPLATIIDVTRCSVSANLIISEAEGRSLYLIPGWPTPGSAGPQQGNNVCVTGNTLKGLMTLPLRGGSLPTPLDRWHVFNAEM
jgi:hypothetical protein